MFSFRLGKYPTARLWHPTVSVCLTLSKVGELFSRVAGLFCIPTSSGRELELLPILASTWPCQLQFLWKYWQPCYLARKTGQQGCATYLLCLLTKYLDQDLTSEPWTVQIRFSLMFSLNPIPLPPPTSMTFGKANSLGNMGTETRNPTVTGESRQAWSSLKNLYSPKDCHYWMSWQLAAKLHPKICHYLVQIRAVCNRLSPRHPWKTISYNYLMSQVPEAACPVSAKRYTKNL